MATVETAEAKVVQDGLLAVETAAGRAATAAATAAVAAMEASEAWAAAAAAVGGGMEEGTDLAR